MGRDVFVSYSQPDKDCAYELTHQLEAGGFTVWIAPRDVSPAAEWAAEIIDAIAAARVMVLVFSASSNTSPQVRREVERAVHKDVRILPFRIEDVLPSRSLEYFLSSQHWLDGFPPPRAAHYERLRGALRQWLTDTPASAASAASAGSVGSVGSVASPAPAAPALPTTASAPYEAALHAVRVSAEQLHELEMRLARILGPIAPVLVERAAAAAPSFAELERQLAAELDSPEDQRRFLRSRQ